jgi:hypothetical protein
LNSEIIKLRKKIYKNLKDKAFSFEAENKELSRYLKDQIRFSKKDFTIIDMDILNKSVLNSDIIYLGDFHTFDQNIRNVLRIVKYILSEKSNCILGLEMVSYEHQLYIDAYLEGHLTDLEFLDCINYHDSWRFPWTHYKLIFELARDFDLKVVALNTSGTLTERDEFASKHLKKTHQENPDAKLLVFYGELHITKNKIPKLFKELCPNLKATIIHQNLDEVYWKLIQNNLEQGIVSFDEEEFCIVSAPPWIKYESMIYWYENLCDDPDFDIHEYIIENGAKTFTEDTNENFLHICLELVFFIKLNPDQDSIEDFNLHDHTHLDYVEERLKESLKPSLLSFYQYLISTNRSFRFPDSNTFYCSSYSMNRISYLAGIHIFHYYSQQKNISTQAVINSKSLSKKFILFCYESMFAYFFSKIINPHRKCDMYGDLKLKTNSGSTYPHITLTTKILDSDDLTPLLKGLKLNILYDSAQYTGHILGEYLYKKYNEDTNNIKLEESFLTKRLSKESFHEIKNELIQREDYKNQFKRYF